MHIIGGRSPNRPLHVGRRADVPMGIMTTITTVPANGVKYLTKITCSGEENARWELYFDNILKETKRTTNRTVDFEWNVPLKVLAAEVIDIKAEHFGPGSTSTLEATVFGFAE